MKRAIATHWTWSTWTKLILVSALFAVVFFELIGIGQRSVVKLFGDRSVPPEHRYDAFGDSITLGNEISFTIDDSGKPRKSGKTYQGWPEVLGALLSARNGFVTAVVNKGHAGDRTEKSRINRLPNILRTSVKANFALLMTGTNDSNDFEPTPSGKYCSGASCEHTFKGEALHFIGQLQESGRDTVYISRLTPAWGPSPKTSYLDPFDTKTATRNNRIQEYNEVITEELAQLPGVRLGPDFFSCFLNKESNRFSLFADSLHPNNLGYMFMAALWRNTITGNSMNRVGDTCPSPIYILESLDAYAHGHKQNLLGVGDAYYSDETHTLSRIPVEIEAGIWVTQANADRHSQETEFLSFDVGSTPVTVYIAYDPVGLPPLSSSHDFEAALLSGKIEVSDESVRELSVVVATAVTGTVAIGGTRSKSGSEHDQQGYVVIVVP